MKKEHQYIFGIHPVLEALVSGKEMEKIFIQRNLKNPLIPSLYKQARERQIPCQQVPVEKLNRITGKNHQGVIAVTSLIEYQQLEQIIPLVFEKGENPLIILLDEITDVRNAGAIVRTAEGAGVHAIVMPAKGSALINADAVKASAGAFFKVPVCRSPRIIDAVDFLKASGLKVVGASEKADRIYYNEELSGPLCLVVGAEGKGISQEILNRCDAIVSIPMMGTIDSLNVSVATGIVLFEVLRQRNN